MEDGQKRFKEKRAADEAGDAAQIWMMDIIAPIRNWQAVSESGPTEAVRKSCLVAMVAATLHTYLPAARDNEIRHYSRCKACRTIVTHQTQTCAARRRTPGSSAACMVRNVWLWDVNARDCRQFETGYARVQLERTIMLS